MINEISNVSIEENEKSDSWDWKGHKDYWPLVFHPESFLNEPIYYLKEVFFFNPEVEVKSV
jgi:hypothetical protein